MNKNGKLTRKNKGLEKFYEQIYQAIIRHVHFDIVKAIIIASPGFVKVRDKADCEESIYNYFDRTKFIIIYLIKQW